MAFLTPLLLVALAGLAIPVFLHLIQKERKNVVQFPSLMFLRRIPYQSVQRRRIRNWPLLLMRLAAFALVVFAFARPFFNRQDLAAAAGSGAREVVVMLDRSYSMAYGDRWNRALSAARDVVNGLGATERGTILLFSTGAEVAVRSTGDKARLLAALSNVEPGAGGTRYGPALKLAGSILAESGLPRREVVLVSDFQRAGWQGADGVRLPDGSVLTPVHVGEEEPTNRSVTPVALQRSMFEGQERVTVTAGVINRSASAARDVPLALEIGGRAIQTKVVSLHANGSASVTFDPVTVTERNMKATVRLPEDSLEPDNAFHFVLTPEDPIRLIIAERSGAARGESLYLSRALAVGESPRFDVRTTTADALSADELDDASVVVLNDTPVSESTATRLQRFVERGGGLFVVVGRRGSWPPESPAMPAAIANPVDRTTGTPARLGALEYGHPVFEIFRAPRSGDFASARFYSYRAATPSQGAQVLARFDDGAAALIEGTVGAGRVMVWTSTFDLDWNDFAIKPVFLPFVHRVVRHLGGYRTPRPWRTVGDVIEPAALTATPAGIDADRVVITPRGDRHPLGEEGPEVLELADQGFYEIRTGADGTAAPPIVVASNVSLDESDLTTMDPEEVRAAAMGRAGTVEGTDAPPPTAEAQESAQRIWWYLLWAGLVLLAAETFVAHRSAI